jgi:hypothetical protein
MNARRRTPRLAYAIAMSVAALSAGCGGTPPPPSATQPQPPAELRTGDVTVRATALHTSQLNDAMARTYGVERDDDTVLLVVGMRRGADANETSLPGKVAVTASDLLGKRQQVTLRAVESGGYIDHVGEFEISMPDTLRFHVDARPQGAPAATLEFSRDFFPATQSP